MRNMETKADIRKRILAKREALSSLEVIKKSEMITGLLLSRKEYQDARNIFLYLDFRNEVSTQFIWKDAIKAKKKVFAPKVTKDGMNFYEIFDEDSVAKGYYGIREPVSSNRTDEREGLMLIPGSVFDRKGNRIGYGKGFYDVYLNHNPNFFKFALAFSFQVVDQIPVEEHDIKMDAILTETEGFLPIAR